MIKPADFSPSLHESLTRLAETSDRTAPTVFAGRKEEFDLLDQAVRGVRRDERGHTVVISGVLGAGKTALLNEYATRLLAAESDDGGPVIPVPLRPDDFDAPPAALLQAIDQQFVQFGSWRGKANRVIAKASWVGNAMSAIATKKNVRDFLPSAQIPNSLDAALEDYASTRFEVKSSTFVLLLDEAQNLNDSNQVRAYLNAMHAGVRGSARVLLACFGLANTVDRLGELGLSRFAADHTRRIGQLTNEDARETVTETIKIGIAHHAFDEGVFDDPVRERWIDTASATILAESANFPHHLANGCRALAGILSSDGIGNVPPTDQLRERCREHKREYYDARVKPWMDHTIALAHVFGEEGGGWKAMDDIAPVLMASDNYGRPVDEDAAIAVIKDMHRRGYLDERMGAFCLSLPSLVSHFAQMVRDAPLHNRTVEKVRMAMTDGKKESKGTSGDVETGQ